MHYFYRVVPKAHFSPQRLDRYSTLPMIMVTLTSTGVQLKPRLSLKNLREYLNRYIYLPHLKE